MAEEEVREFLIKITVIGGVKSGKTCLGKRFVDDVFPTHYTISLN